MIKEFNISTQQGYQLVDITDQVEEIIEENKDGLVLVFTPHSTAGIVLTENEEGLKNDWLSFLKRTISGFDFKHNRIDDNADSHILAGLVGQGKVLPLQKGRLVLGTWQQIFLVEFDGPRERKIIVQIIREDK